MNDIPETENLYLEMIKLDTLMGVVNIEEGSNSSNNKKLLSQLNTCIKLSQKNPLVIHMDSVSGRVIDIKYLKSQKKELIRFMKSKRLGF